MYFISLYPADCTCPSVSSDGVWLIVRVCVFQVTVPGEVVDVACGVDHMVAITKSLI